MTHIEITLAIAIFILIYKVGRLSKRLKAQHNCTHANIDEINDRINKAEGTGTAHFAALEKHLGLVSIKKWVPAVKDIKISSHPAHAEVTIEKAKKLRVTPSKR